MPIETKCNFLQKTSEDHIEFFAWDLLILTWCFSSYFLRGKRVSSRYSGHSRYYCDRECMWMRLCDCECGAKCRWALSEPFVKKCRLLSQAGRQSVTQSVSQSPPSSVDIHTHTVAVPFVCVCVCVFCAHLKIKQHWKMLMPGDRQSDRPNPPTTYNRSTSRRPMPDLSRTPVCPHTHTQRYRDWAHTHTPKMTATNSVEFSSFSWTENWTLNRSEYRVLSSYV